MGWGLRSLGAAGVWDMEGEGGCTLAFFFEGQLSLLVVVLVLSSTPILTTLRVSWSASILLSNILCLRGPNILLRLKAEEVARGSASAPLMNGERGGEDVLSPYS